jgi:hypothetical protein
MSRSSVWICIVLLLWAAPVFAQPFLSAGALSGGSESVVRGPGPVSASLRRISAAPAEADSFFLFRRPFRAVLLIDTR